MPRKGISKKEVIDTIHQLIEKKEVPTALGIRHLLGRGSLTTIQKHFRNWKMASFASHRTDAENLNKGLKSSLKKNSEEGRLLEQKVVELEGQQQVLSQELIKREQENLKLNQENLKLTQNLAEITEAHKALWLKFEDLSKSYEDLKAERETTLQKILEDRNKHIERLSLELKEIHEVHLNAIKEIGQRGDELLLQEKVKTIGLSDKVKELQNQQKALTEKLDKETKTKEPLQRELRRFEALIKHFVTPEQLQAFEQKQGGSN